MIPCPACELVAVPLFGGFCPNNNCPRHMTVHPTYDRIFGVAHPYSLLSWAQGYTLFTAAKQVPLEGDFAEFGVYRGGSSLILHLADDRRALHLFDTFAGHPPRHDAKHDRPGSHQAGTLGNTSPEQVARLLEDHGTTRVELWQGIFPDDHDTDLIPPLALIHVDVDLWKSARDALRIFTAKLVPGGMFVMDDYGGDECPGVWEAVEEFAMTHTEQFTVERTAYPTYQAIFTKNL